MTARAPSSSPASPAEAIVPGRHARTDVDLDAVVSAQVPIELSLAAPFGALLSALLLDRPFRVSRLSLDYVAADRLSSWATFSAKVSDVKDEGEATISLLVFRGARLCVRGHAEVRVGAARAAAPASANGKASFEHMNGGSR